MMCGGKGPEQAANEDVQALLDEAKPHIHEKLGSAPSELKAVKYASQVVNGVNYFIKAHIGGDKYVHVRLHKALPHAGGAVTLHSIQADKSEQEPIEYF